MRNYDNETIASIRRPIVQATVIMLIFYAIEIAMVYLDLFPDRNVLRCVDIFLRIIMGSVSLKILDRPLKPLMTRSLTPAMWLMIVPFMIYVALPLIKLFYADIYVPDKIPVMSIVIAQQFATGYYEESCFRGLMMDGLIKHNMGTTRQRLFTAGIAGLFFGLTHLPNIFFGENPLIQVPFCAVWGFFIAVVFMLTDNLLLVMLLHAISDITPKLVRGLFGWNATPSALHVIDIIGYVFDFVILPLVAVYICIRFNELRKKEGRGLDTKFAKERV